jgi:chromosome partitioning protein
MLKTIIGVRQKYNPKLKLLGIFANRFNAHSPRQKTGYTELLEEYGEFVRPVKIPTRSAIPEALAKGVPPWRLAKSSARETSAELLAFFELLRKKMDGKVGDGVEAA